MRQRPFSSFLTREDPAFFASALESDVGARLGAPDAVVRCFVPPPDDFESAQTLGQAWDGLRWWLSAARDDGLNLAVVGGPEVGVDDAAGWGFGRPTMLDASQLGRVAEALRTVKVTPDEHAPPTSAVSVTGGSGWKRATVKLVLGS